MTHTDAVYEVQGHDSKGNRIFTATRKSRKAAEKLAESKRTPFAHKHGATFTVVQADTGEDN